MFTTDVISLQNTPQTPVVCLTLGDASGVRELTQKNTRLSEDHLVTGVDMSQRVSGNSPQHKNPNKECFRSDAKKGVWCVDGEKILMKFPLEIRNFTQHIVCGVKIDTICVNPQLIHGNIQFASHVLGLVNFAQKSSGNLKMQNQVKKFPTKDDGSVCPSLSCDARRCAA